MLVALAAILAAAPAAAHDVRPTIADVTVSQNDIELDLQITLEGFVAGVNLDAVDNVNDAPQAERYDALRAMPPAALEAELRNSWDRIAPGFVIETGGVRVLPQIVAVNIPEVGTIDLPRDSVLTLRAELPHGSAPVQVGLGPGYGTFVPREMTDSPDAYEGFLASGDLTPPLSRTGAPNAGSGFDILRAIGTGFSAIIPFGYGHILLALGAFFFAPRPGPLVWQGAAFTLGYAAMLVLASADQITVPPHFVGPLIAVSLVYVGIDSALGRSPLRIRAAMLFGFGLLHGLGFAGALVDHGAAAGPSGVAVIGWIIGLALGLVAVVALAFALSGRFIGKPWYRQAIAVPASLVIAAIGAYWVVAETLF